METIEQQIEKTIDKMRPFMQRDGGDIQFVGFEDGVVFVRMLGACSNCAFVDETISMGVEALLLEEVPGVVAVKVVH